MRVVLVMLMLGAVVIGAAAYQAGNISGGSLGLMNFGLVSVQSAEAVLLIASLAALALWFGSYVLLERVLMGLVAIMSLAFVITAILVTEHWGGLVNALFSISMPEHSALIIVGLIGTTIVPYNLFLHSDLVAKKWAVNGQLSTVRRDTAVAIVLGGLVSSAIVVCAAAIEGSQITSVIEMSTGLRPLAGDTAPKLLSIGLFAAGLTSAITAPLAAAVVCRSCFNWPAKHTDWRHRLVWAAILLIGSAVAISGIDAIELIKVAQFANGLMLPLAVILLLYLVNQKRILGSYTNGRPLNTLMSLILLIVLVLGARGVLQAVA